MRDFVIKRVIQMFATLFFVSVVAFIIIQLPPGDFLSSYIAQLESLGQTADEAYIAALRQQFGLDRPMYVQYFIWITGFIRGNFGFSFEWRAPVRDLIGERMLLTVILTLATILLTWALAFLLGLYSSVRQYSVGDYIATFIGFIGVSVPSFLIAIVLMWIFLYYFGIGVGGLFSRDFVTAPWSIARVMDLMRNMILPVIVIGLTGTASLMRTLRANMLDEITRPYVTAAKAKGVPSTKLIIKYPLRIAMLPFISTVGWQVPVIINGQTIAGVVLSLPVLGPMLLNALVSQDMFLAGSIILFLSMLTVVGTFISDILLAWADPRVRLQ